MHLLSQSIDQKRLPSWANQLPCGIIFLDEEFRVVCFSDKAKHLSEKAPMGSLREGVSVTDFILEDQRALFADNLRCDGEFLYEFKDQEGNEFWYRFSLEKTEAKAEPKTNILVLEDQTDLYVHLKAAKQREVDLKQSVLTRETLLSIISHDLRSPIFQLNGLLFLIEQSSVKNDFRKIMIHSRDLQERIFHLTNVMDNLLRWSSEQGKRLVAKTTCFDSMEVIKSTIGVLKPLIDSKNIKLDLLIEGNKEIETDRELFAFLMRNLLSNAIKYSKENKHIEINLTESNNAVCFYVKDFGSGIDDATLEAIRDPEQYFTKPGTSGEQGTGLGLKLCYQFVSLMDGELEIDTKVGQGTEVCLKFPIR